MHDDLISLWTCLWRWGAWLVLAAHRWKLLCVSSPYLSQDDRIRLTSHQTRLVCDLITSRVLVPSSSTWHWWTIYKFLLSKYPHKLLVMSEGSVATHLKAHIMRLAVTKRVSHYQSWRSQITNIFHWQILNQYSQFHTIGQYLSMLPVPREHLGTQIVILERRLPSRWIIQWYPMVPMWKEGSKWIRILGSWDILGWQSNGYLAYNHYIHSTDISNSDCSDYQLPITSNYQPTPLEGWPLDCSSAHHGDLEKK